jgi:hypothetical protein
MLLFEEYSKHHDVFARGQSKWPFVKQTLSFGMHPYLDVPTIKSYGLQVSITIKGI